MFAAVYACVYTAVLTSWVKLLPGNLVPAWRQRTGELSDGRRLARGEAAAQRCLRQTRAYRQLGLGSYPT